MEGAIGNNDVWQGIRITKEECTASFPLFINLSQAQIPTTRCLLQTRIYPYLDKNPSYLKHNLNENKLGDNYESWC